MNTPVTASVVWTDPRGNVMPTNEKRRRVMLPISDSFVSMLSFQPIDTGRNNDGGTYICQMIINSGNSLITSNQPTNTTLGVTIESKVIIIINVLLIPSLAVFSLYFFSFMLSLSPPGLPPMTVDFSSVGTVEVGQSLTITCTITTVERLVVTPLITFTKINETNIEMLSNIDISTTNDGSVTNYTLILDPVRFEDAGMYTCMAEFNVTGFNNTNDPSTATYDSQEDSDVFNLIVNCKLIIYMYFYFAILK